MTLISTSAPHGDESGKAYYRRLAAENWLRGWRELADMAQVARSRGGLMERPERMATALGLEVAWSEAASRQDLRSQGWRGLRRVSTDAICPGCLCDEIYLRQHWEHVYVTACPAHQNLLIDRCPECGELLRPKRDRIEFCACGHDLRVSDTVESSLSQHWLSALIASGGSSSGAATPLLHHADISALCDLVSTLCAGANPSSSLARKNAARVKTIAEAVEFLAPLERLLADWPASFEKHVAERIQAGRVGARTLNSLLGQWYSRVRKACEDKALEPFLKIVLAVAERDFDGALSLDSAHHVAAEVTRFNRATVAAKQLGVSRAQLVNAAKNGLCEHRTRRLGTRGLVYEIPQAEVDRISKARREWLPEDRACEMAAVPASVLHRMAAAGVVQYDPKWRTDILKGGPFETKSLQTLYDRISATVKPQRHHHGECINWSELTSRRMGDKQAIQSAMRAIAAGELTAVVRGKKLGQMGFLKSDVAAYFGTPVLESGMSVQQLSQATGWKWESISHWIDVGLLSSQHVTLRGQPCRVITPQQLLAFRQIYLPLADLARAMGTKSSWLAEQLAGLQIVGAQVLSSGARRGGLVRMSDLGQLALAGARADAMRGSFETV